MDGWRAGVLAAMIVVFVLLAVGVVWFVWRRCFGAAGPAEPFLFYLYDMGGVLRVLDLRTVEGHPISEGCASVFDLHNREHFLLALGRLCGDTDTKTLAVCRRDAGGYMIEIDLEAFLRAEARDANITSTAILPCVVGRHHVFSQLSATVAVPMPGTQQSNTRALSRPQCPPPPPPLVSPVAPNITTNTPLLISAASYRYTDGDAEVLPQRFAERIEQTFEAGGGAVSLGGTVTAHVNGSDGSVVVSQSGAEPRNARRCPPESGTTISYGFEGPHHSRPYAGAFYLPPGKWSLCATVRNRHGGFTSHSRVYTVESS